jgi:hypothetical protein
MVKPKNKTDLRMFIGLTVGFACVIAIIAVLRFDTTGRQGSGLGKEFEYNLEQIGKIDPNLILYKETVRPIKTGFAESHAIDVDANGTIYVAGDELVRNFNDNGTSIGEFKLKETPLSLAIDDANNSGSSAIFVGLKDHLEIYNTSGVLLKQWASAGENAHLTSIAVSGDNVFVADAGNRIVYRYDKSGRLINRIGQKNDDRNIPGFVIPSPYFDLAVSRDGLLRVVNPGEHHIETYTFAGDLESVWGEYSNKIEGFCGCCNPVNFAILPGPDVTGAKDKFITSEKGLTRVKVYDSKGKFIGVVAGPQQLIEGGKVEVCDSPSECQMGGFDVVVGPDGRIFVLDTIKNIIRIFSSVQDSAQK